MRVTLAILALTAIAFPATAQVREVRLDEAVQMGIDHAPDLRLGGRDAEKAHAESWSALGAMGPRLSTDGGVQYWDKATSVDIAGSFLSILPAGMMTTLGIDPSKIPPMRVQDRLTWAVNLQAVQPLTPLYPLYYLWRVNRLNEDAANITQEGNRDAVRYRVSEAFFRVLAAQRMIEVARKAVEQVEAHLKTARSFEAAGVVGRDDVLRAEAALARAQDGLNQATYGTALARAVLNVTIGLPQQTETQPVGDYPENPPAFAPTEAQVADKALAARSEVRSTEKRVLMAEAGRQAAIGAMIPTVAGVFRYGHTEGSQFQRKDAYFVGASFSWNFWEWGSSYFKVKSVEADRAKAEDARQAVHDGVVLDVAKAFMDLRNARSSIDMNRKAIEASDEALRVVTKKFEASTATTTDVLDAQGALTQARAAYQVAVFNYYTAVANLRRAAGTDL